jgi:hypothetical protein
MCQVGRARMREKASGAAEESGAQARRDRHLGSTYRPHLTGHSPARPAPLSKASKSSNGAPPAYAGTGC